MSYFVTEQISGAPSVVDANNSSTATLLANAVFTGTSTDVSNYASVQVGVFSNVASATNGLSLQFSSDGTHWDFAAATTYPGGVGATIPSGTREKFFRVVYTNGSVGQASFRLSTKLTPVAVEVTKRFLSQPPTDAQLAILTDSVLSGKDPLSATYKNVTTDSYGNLSVVPASQSSDAFSRSRFSLPVELFAAQFQYDAQPLLFQTQTVGGSVAKTAGISSLTLSTGGTTQGNFAINQTKAYCRYFPGRSQQVLMTGDVGAQKANVQQSIGYFDSNDGLFFRMDGTLGMCIVERSSTTGQTVSTLAISLASGGTGYAVGDVGNITGGGGSGATYLVLAVNAGVVTQVMLTAQGSGYTTAAAVATMHTSGSGADNLTLNLLSEVVVTQANWNVDTFGAGSLNPSGLTLDFSKGQIFALDFEWLGVGRVRYGFFVNGMFLTAHVINNANGVFVPYTNTANLPCRAQIQNTGTAASGTSMTQICMTVLAEGSETLAKPSAYQFTASNVVTSVTAASGTRTPVLSIRPKVTFNSVTNRAQILLENLDLLIVSGNTNVFWEIVYNGTLTGSPVFNSADNNSIVNFDVAASGITLTGGTSVVIASGYVAAANGHGSQSFTPVEQKVPITLDITGATPDTITVCATGIGGTAPVTAALSWLENR